MRALIDFDDISYDAHADLLYDLAVQDSAPFQSIYRMMKITEGAALLPERYRRVYPCTDAGALLGGGDRL